MEVPEQQVKNFTEPGKVAPSLTCYSIIPILLLLVPFILLCMYCWPSGDDYSYAVAGSKQGAYLKNVFREWYTWNGRYTSNFLVMANPIGRGYFGLYRLMPAIFMLLFLVSNMYLFRKLISLSYPAAWLASLVFLLMYLTCMPHLGEGIYWYTAAVTYFVPVIIFPLYLILCKKIWQSKHWSGITGLLLLQLLLTGLNEIMMMSLIILTAIVYFRSVVRYGKYNSHFLLLLTGQIVFSLIVVLAPGNEIRSAYFPQKNDVYNTLTMTFINVRSYLWEWFRSPPFWTGSLLLLSILPVPQTSLFRLSPVSWAILLLSPLIIACAGPIWTTGIIGQQRTVNLSLYFTLLIFIAFLLNIPGTALYNKWIARLKSINIYVLSGLFILSVAIWKNGRNSIADLVSGEAQAFHLENIEREQLLLSLGSLKDTVCSIPAYKHFPASVFIYDIEEDPGHWKNESYTLYYGLKDRGIQIKKE